MITKTVVGEFGSVTGTVSFRPSIARYISVSTGLVQVAGTKRAMLDDSGNISITLYATNDTDIEDAPFTYTVTCNLSTGTFQFSMTVDKDAVGSIDLADFVPVGTNPSPIFPDSGATVDDINDAITAHDAAADPHTGYQRESEKNQPSGYVGLDGSSKIADSQLPTTMDGKTLTNAVIASGGGSTIDASRITSGTLSDSRLPTTMAGKTLTTAVLAAASGTTIDGSLITSGTVSDSRLPTTLAGHTLTTAVLAAASGTTIDGTLITSGTISDSRLPTSLSGKTLVTPTIASFVNAGHNHSNAAGGGTLDGGVIATGTVADARLPSTMDGKTLTNAVIAAGGGTTIDASRITSGTLSDSRLPTTMAGKTLTTAVLAAASGTTIDGSLITSGTVADGRLPTTMAGKTLTTAVLAAASGTTIDGTLITSGTISDSRLPTTMAGKTLTSAVLAAASGTTIDGSLITSGTVADGRLPTTLAGHTLTTATLTAPTIADLTNMNHGHTGATSGGTLSGSAIASGTVADARLPTTMAGKTLTTATLTQPTIADFTLANHTHTGASSGGAISTANVKLTTATVANTTTATQVGSFANLIPAGAAVNGYYQISVFGNLSATGTPTLGFDIRDGSTVIATINSGTAVVSGASGRTFYLELRLYVHTAGATGNYEVYGYIGGLAYATGNGDTRWMSSVTASSSFDLTVARTINIYATWGTASASNTVSTLHGMCVAIP